MPSYELLVIFKTMKRPELVTAIKRTAETLWTHGAVLTKLENMGSKTLPYKIRSSGKNHTTGNYFLYHFEAAPSAIGQYMDFYDRDIDIIRPTIALKSERKPHICTLEEELLPPAYRKDVADLLVEGKKNKKQLFKPYVLEIISKPF
uniref:Small ribosomal subunit protein bS6m n=1 Tax=Strigamia maritima TaxID=126957 RepID=T1JCB3_STRMM